MLVVADGLWLLVTVQQQPGRSLQVERVFCDSFHSHVSYDILLGELPS